MMPTALVPHRQGRSTFELPESHRRFFSSKNTTEPFCESTAKPLNASFMQRQAWAQEHTEDLERTANQSGRKNFSPHPHIFFYFYFFFNFFLWQSLTRNCKAFGFAAISAGGFCFVRGSICVQTQSRLFYAVSNSVQMEHDMICWSGIYSIWP